VDIRGYLQTSLNEWPGKISAVVWVSGCNFRCPFCDNHDLVLDPQKLPQISEKKIFQDLKTRKKWLDAVCITGGEPTLQPDLASFLTKIKKIGLLTMLETNGSQPKVLKKLFQKKLLDRISMDIKGPFEDYEKIVGVKMKNLKFKIKNSLQLIVDSGIDFELRTTVVPTIHTKESLIKLAKQLKNLVRQSPVWFLQQFVPQNCLDPQFEKIKPYSKKEMEVFLTAIRKHFSSAKLRGL